MREFFKYMSMMIWKRLKAAKKAKKIRRMGDLHRSCSVSGNDEDEATLANLLRSCLACAAYNYG